MKTYTYVLMHENMLLQKAFHHIVFYVHKLQKEGLRPVLA